MMFTPHVLARTDRRFHGVSYRVARMASESQEAHETDNKVTIIFSSWKLNHPSIDLHVWTYIYCGWLCSVPAWAE